MIRHDDGFGAVFCRAARIIAAADSFNDDRETTRCAEPVEILKAQILLEVIPDVSRETGTFYLGKISLS